MKNPALHDPVGRFSNVVIDCADAEAMAGFWTAMLGVEVTVRWNQYVILTPTVPGGPAITFQEVPEPKRTKNRVHLDLTVDDLPVASTRAVRLGAMVLSETRDDGVTAQVLGDVEGNEFCLVRLPTPTPPP